MSAVYVPSRGPWTFQAPPSNYGIQWKVLDATGQVVCKVWPEEDARLIAAAPELLDALKTAEEILKGLRPNNDTIDALDYARTIIAKATGSKP